MARRIKRCCASEPNRSENQEEYNREEMQRHGFVEGEGEEEYDKVESDDDAQLPATPASSSGATSPSCATTPKRVDSFSSSSDPNSTPQSSPTPASSFDESSVPSDAVDPETESTSNSTMSYISSCEGSKAQSESPFLKLPNELVVEVLRYALHEDNIYDTLVEIEGEDMTQEEYEYGFNSTGSLVVGDDGNSHFLLIRREVVLSHVCWLWRDLIRGGYLDLWDLQGECLHVTGQQWFHPSFPFTLLEGEGYSHINISFKGSCTPQKQSENLISSEDIEAPLFEPPPDANYHDALPRKRRINLSSTRFVRLILSEGSNIAIDSVFSQLNFPLNQAINIIFSVKSGSRLFVGSRYFPGLPISARVFGGPPLSSNIISGVRRGEAGLNLVFDINSWMANYGWEVRDCIYNIVQWFGGRIAHEDPFYAKIPRTSSVTTELELPRRGWRDGVANIFYNSNSVWDKWDTSLSGQHLCEHHYDTAIFINFDEEENALWFRSLSEGNKTRHIKRKKMLLLTHPIRGFWGFVPILSAEDSEMEEGPLPIRFKGFDISGERMVGQDCDCVTENPSMIWK
ncbi:hypothetical protein BDZ91DRAFT_265996 [Kalaharituber pfeilii]|nr:hypothetical protein BDZ91DRAFT_265996 [Kalaharituber pfeilii]